MNKNSILKSFFWKFLERAGTQIVNLVVQVILARLIAPSEFGCLAVLIVFVNIANIFIQKGLSSSIVRKKNADDLDYDTSLWASFALAGLLYIIIFFTAPFIAKLYNSSILTLSLRIFSLQLFFGSLYCIQNAILVREMQFKSIFVRGMISSIGAGVIGIALAYLGGGLWALVAQTLMNQILCCLTAWNVVSWKPKFRFSKKRLSEILSFGGKILISELLNYSVEGIRTLAIGKAYSTEALSFYDRGQTYPATLMRGVYDTIGGVLLPVFSRKQENDEDLGNTVIQSCSITFYLTTPVFVGMAAVANSLIPLLLTDKWIGAIPFFVLFSFYWIPYPIQGICKNGIYAKGDSDSVLKIEIAKTVITFATLALALFISPFAIAVAALITMFLTTLLYVLALYKIIHFSIIKLIAEMIKTAVSVVIMYFLVRMIEMLNVGNILTLLLQVCVGAISYLFISFVIKDKNLFICLNMIKGIKKNSIGE